MSHQCPRLRHTVAGQKCYDNCRCRCVGCRAGNAARKRRDRARRAGAPRSTRVYRREDLLHEVAHLRSCGESWPRVAERLGIKHDAFQRAMERARAAGDARAASFRGMAS